MTKKSKLKDAFPANTLHAGVLETDAAKNAAADKVIEISLDEETLEVPDELVAQAGRKALANRHIFVIQAYEDGSGFMMTGTSIAYLKNTGNFSERTGLINAIFPDDCGEVCEMTWEYNNPKTIEDAVRELRDIGFMWDEVQQKDTDKAYKVKIAPTIKKIYAEIAPKPEKPVKKKSPKLAAIRSPKR